ncbi:hypothetical protein Bca101_057654 [Brassica carinata]
MSFVDEIHLTRAQWLKDGHVWSFINDTDPNLIELPLRGVTNFRGDFSRLEFHPSPLLPVHPPVRLRRRVPAAHTDAGPSAAHAAPGVVFRLLDHHPTTRPSVS